MVKLSVGFTVDRGVYPPSVVRRVTDELVGRCESALAVVGADDFELRLTVRNGSIDLEALRVEFYDLLIDYSLGDALAERTVSNSAII